MKVPLVFVLLLVVLVLLAIATLADARQKEQSLPLDQVVQQRIKAHREQRTQMEQRRGQPRNSGAFVADKTGLHELKERMRERLLRGRPALEPGDLPLATLVPSKQWMTAVLAYLEQDAGASHRLSQQLPRLHELVEKDDQVLYLLMRRVFPTNVEVTRKGAVLNEFRRSLETMFEDRDD